MELYQVWGGLTVIIDAPEFVSDFMYVAPFRNAGGSKTRAVSKIEAKLRIFCPRHVKIRKGLARFRR